MYFKKDIGIFDYPHALSLAEAKKRFLNSFLPEIIKQERLMTALDIGCGFGYFSNYLKELGLEVSGFDARAENIKEAKIRVPNIEFLVSNIEDQFLLKSRKFDLVFCLGLIYHLENPFCAMKNLFSLTDKICVIESVVSPFSSVITNLFEENEGQDQGLNYIAQVPSEAWLIKVLYKVGFAFVYKMNMLPNHQDFYSSIIRRKKRIFLIAAKSRLSHHILKIAPYPTKTNRYMWYRFGMGNLLEYNRLKKYLKKLLGRNA